jgi:hypothetical protein
MKIKVQMEAVSIAYDLKEFDIMNRIAKLSVDRCVGGEKVFFALTEIFSRDVFSRKDFDDFRNDWSVLNRENTLWEGAKFINKEYMELFTHMSTVCRFVNRRSVRISAIINKLKEPKQEKWCGKYHKMSRDFFNGGYAKANTEAREAIGQMKNESVRNLELEADFYLIGIDASIKESNPDRDLIKESERIASNDPAIILRS